MPTTKVRNLLYRVALPVLAPRVGHQMAVRSEGEALHHPEELRRILVRHHVLGASILLKDGERVSRTDVSTVSAPVHTASADTLYRVASITKTATAAVLLTLCDEGACALDDAVNAHLPEHSAVLDGVTLRQLLSHTSGLRDIAACDAALRSGDTWQTVLAAPGIRVGRPGEGFAYCNFGFGLLGCTLEHITGQPLDALFREKLFTPLRMTATLDGSTVDEARVMEIARVLPYRAGSGVRVTSLGRRAIDQPDPMRHFGHTAGSLYTDAASLSHLVGMLSSGGTFGGKRVLSAASVAEMTREQASYGALSPTLAYGLGLLIIRDPALSTGRILGHQGFAYGCVDGAFFEEDTGRQLISLNGGASEARDGRLGLLNRDMLRFALRRELPAWT